MLRQLTDEGTHRLPATLKPSFRDLAAKVIRLGSVTKAFTDMLDLETITLSPTCEGRITRINE